MTRKRTPTIAKAWTKNEMAFLSFARDQHISLGTIAKLLKRSYASVGSKDYYLTELINKDPKGILSTHRKDSLTEALEFKKQVYTKPEYKMLLQTWTDALKEATNNQTNETETDNPDEPEMPRETVVPVDEPKFAPPESISEKAVIDIKISLTAKQLRQLHQLYTSIINPNKEA